MSTAAGVGDRVMGSIAKVIVGILLVIVGFFAQATYTNIDKIVDKHTSLEITVAKLEESVRNSCTASDDIKRDVEKAKEELYRLSDRLRTIEISVEKSWRKHDS